MALSTHKASSKNSKNMLGKYYVLGAIVAALLCLFSQCGYRATLQIVASGMAVVTIVCVLKELVGTMLFPGKSKPKHAKLQVVKAVRGFLLPFVPWLRTFEDRLEEKMTMLRYRFTVELNRNQTGEPKKIGLQLLRVEGSSGNLEVQGVLPDSLIEEQNKSILNTGPRSCRVIAGDELIKVNTHDVPPVMMEEMANLSVIELSLQFARPAKPTQHFQLWEVELEKIKKDEPWGMQLDDLPDFDGLVVQRVIAGGVVSRWNRKAAQRCKKEQTIYPGDWILACESELSASKFTDTLRTSQSVRLTLLRWFTSQVGVSEEEPQTAAVGGESPVAAASSEKGAITTDKNDAEVCGQDETLNRAVFTGPQCSCCSQNCDKYVVMRCAAGEVKHFRRECWRKAYGGFTPKCCPAQCACGAKVANIGVYEWCPQNEEARLVHTIQHTVVDPRPTAANGARRRASSARRAVARTVPVVDQNDTDGEDANQDLPQGGARRRGASADRVVPRFALPEDNAEARQGADEQVGDAPDFWRPARARREAPAPDLLATGATDAADSVVNATPKALPEQTKSKSAAKQRPKQCIVTAETKEVVKNTGASSASSEPQTDGIILSSAVSEPPRQQITMEACRQIPAVPTAMPPPVPQRGSGNEASSPIAPQKMWQCDECGYKLNLMHWSWCYVCQVDTTAAGEQPRIETMEEVLGRVLNIKPKADILVNEPCLDGTGVAAPDMLAFRPPPGLDILDGSVCQPPPGLLSPAAAIAELVQTLPGLAPPGRSEPSMPPPGLVAKATDMMSACVEDLPPPPGLGFSASLPLDIGIGNASELGDVGVSDESAEKRRRWGLAAARARGEPVTPGYLGVGMEDDDEGFWK